MNDQPDQPTDQVDAQAREQTASQQARLQVDERNMTTSYANAFRTNMTAEEVIVDFGLNMVAAAQDQSTDAEARAAGILFQANNRVVLNYYSAKRLALTLGQIVQRHEQQFGDLKLNAADRTIGDASA